MASKPDSTAPRRVASYKARMKEKGYRTVEVWVKEQDVELVKEYAKFLRDRKT